MALSGLPVIIFTVVWLSTCYRVQNGRASHPSRKDHPVENLEIVPDLEGFTAAALTPAPGLSASTRVFSRTISPRWVSTTNSAGRVPARSCSSRPTTDSGRDTRSWGVQRGHPGRWATGRVGLADREVEGLPATATPRGAAPDAHVPAHANPAGSTPLHVGHGRIPRLRPSPRRPRPARR